MTKILFTPYPPNLPHLPPPPQDLHSQIHSPHLGQAYKHHFCADQWHL